MRLAPIVLLSTFSFTKHNSSIVFGVWSRRMLKTHISGFYHMGRMLEVKNGYTGDEVEAISLTPKFVYSMKLFQWSEIQMSRPL